MHPVDRGDLTARARIRNAALDQFAERGFKGATVKQIADAAGVSHGLLQHHFGSKDDLRRACDEYVMEMFGGLDQLGASNGEMTDPDFMADLLARSPMVTRYVARAMAEGAPVAASLFVSGADLGEQWLARSFPDRFAPGAERTRDAAAVMAAMHLSTMVLHRLLSDRLGADVLAAGHDRRVPLAMLDVYGAMGQWVQSHEGAGVRSAVSATGTGAPRTARVDVGSVHEEGRDA